jgi:hypothetical protein
MAIANLRFFMPQSTYYFLHAVRGNWQVSARLFVVDKSYFLA